ncbi:hypothetical protein H2200_004165 [Cladophialophora chaetospira]|uniref:Uncharacterized protein n=1 Tax=Cladophialophora chaetospira TaxID=386627 RepID=A0AA38XFK9_9EURO|nr:hypothetical protein H2200_004165 [Cladophialophora chaetospira]
MPRPPRWKNVVNITAALASFLITICYLLFSAIPTYNRPTWASGVEFVTEVPVPAIAFVIQHNNINGMPLPVNYTYLSNGQLATSFTYTSFDVHNGVDAPGGVYQELIELPWGNFTAIVANSSAIQPVLTSPLGSGIAVGLGLTFNSTTAANVTGYVPQLLMAVFDARMPIYATLECGLIQPLAVAAFTDSTFLISMSQIADSHGITRPPAEAPASCLETYEHLISDPRRPLTFFDTSLTQSSSSVSNYTAECDVEVDPDAFCRSSATFAWGTQFVRKQTSIPGRSKQEIWIDCGAIVGAVQFFAWFAMVFLHG